MKKLLFLLIFSTILVSCKQETQEIIAEEFEYKGHTYIIFRFPNKYTLGIEHSPDCPKCFEIYD